MIHVRFDGRSYDLDAGSLGIRPDMRLNDGEILERVARHLDLRPWQLGSYVVDRRPGGQIVVRPEAVYG